MGSQLTSWRVRKPRAKIGLTGCAARRAASAAASPGHRQPGMVEECAAGGGQFDAVNAAADQRNADFIFQIADLAAEGRLRRVQTLRRCTGEAAFFGDRDEEPKVA